MNASQIEKARHFANLHIQGDPVIIYNIWDAASAKAVAKAGAAAIATGSWSVAAAHAYDDGEAIPLSLLETLVKRIVVAVDLPVSIDFEGAYAIEPNTVADNVECIIKAGAIGINFEDQIVGGHGLYETQAQAARIAAIRQRADSLSVPIVINARTDLFLKTSDEAEHQANLNEAKVRAKAYADAGATSFFIPGLVNPAMIAEICKSSPIPVNVMVLDTSISMTQMAQLGVARISFGPQPFRAAMKQLSEDATKQFTQPD